LTQWTYLGRLGRLTYLNEFLGLVDVGALEADDDGLLQADLLGRVDHTHRYHITPENGQ